MAMSAIRNSDRAVRAYRDLWMRHAGDLYVITFQNWWHSAWPDKSEQYGVNRGSCSGDVMYETVLQQSLSEATPEQSTTKPSAIERRHRRRSIVHQQKRKQIIRANTIIRLQLGEAMREGEWARSLQYLCNHVSKDHFIRDATEYIWHRSGRANEARKIQDDHNWLYNWAGN